MFQPIIQYPSSGIQQGILFLSLAMQFCIVYLIESCSFHCGSSKNSLDTLVPNLGAVEWLSLGDGSIPRQQASTLNNRNSQT